MEKDLEKSLKITDESTGDKKSEDSPGQNDESPDHDIKASSTNDSPGQSTESPNHYVKAQDDSQNPSSESVKTADPIDTSNLSDTNGSNKCTVKCEECGSLILSEGLAEFVSEVYELPTPTQPRHAPSPTTVQIKQWWSVDNIFTFDNIGFSHTVGTVKYLVCADCERGPLGWHNTATQRSYVALERVKNVL